MAACSRPRSASRWANWSTTSAAAPLSGRPVRAVQVGGPLGAYFPRALFDTPFDYEAFAARDGLIGHGGIVVFDDTVDMAQAGALRHGVLRRRILRQMHALPHRLDPRRRDHRQDPSPANASPRTSRCCDDLCDTMKFGSLCALGGFTPYPVMSALEPFPGRFRPGADAPRKPRNKETAMSLIQEIDYGTPALRIRDAMVTLTIDGQSVTVPEGTSIMRAAMEAGTQIPKLCATDSSRPSAPAGCAWSRSRAAPARRPPAPRRSTHGMVVHTQTERLKKLRKGVMELYISDHPLDCLTCAANGDCELQDMAGAVGLRDVRYGYEGENHVFANPRHANAPGCRRTNPIPISPTIPRNASSARAACAPARKCRAPSR